MQKFKNTKISELKALQKNSKLFPIIQLLLLELMQMYINTVTNLDLFEVNR